MKIIEQMRYIFIFEKIKPIFIKLRLVQYWLAKLGYSRVLDDHRTRDAIFAIFTILFIYQVSKELGVVYCVKVCLVVSLWNLFDEAKNTLFLQFLQKMIVLKRQFGLSEKISPLNVARPCQRMTLYLVLCK